MAHLVVLAEDGPLGKAGEHVWVDDAAPVEKPAAARKAPAKKQANES